MRGLALAISAECSQASVGGAIGMAHQKDLRCLVQQNRHAHLFQNKVALKIIAWRGQCFCSTGYDDHVRTDDFLPLQKFVYRQADALIEAAKHSGIGYVGVWRRIKVKGLFHEVRGTAFIVTKSLTCPESSV